MNKTLISTLVLGLLISSLFLAAAQESYVKGVIDVGFNDGVTESEAKSLIEENGLVLGEGYTPWREKYYYLHVKVPEGQEQKWIEIFENETIVKYASLSPINYITEKDYKIYYILGAIIIILFILFLILRNIKKWKKNKG